MQNHFFSIIITTYKRPDLLKIALESIKKQTYPQTHYETVVVDNDPAGKNYLIKTSKNFKWVKEKKLGTHYARHRGAKAARGDILVFINDDVIVDRNWLRAYNNAYNQIEADAIGGKVEPLWLSGKPRWLSEVPISYFSLLDLGKKSKVLRKPILVGTNFSIRKKILIQMGGFNPDLFGSSWLGDGETGLQKKMLKASLVLAYEPKAVLQHIIPPERTTINFIKNRAYNEGAGETYAEHKVKNYSKLNLFIRVLVFIGYAMAAEIFYYYYRLSDNLKFFHFAWIAQCYRARAFYNSRLLYDKALMKFIKKDSWI